MLGLVSGLVALKLLLAWQLPLFGDEAFYWLESRHPAVAHDDVPATTPLLIRLGTLFGGDSALGLRWPFLLLSLLSLGLIARSAADVGGRDNAALAVMLTLAVPLAAADGLLALPDVPLNLAVLLCLYALQRLLRAVDRTNAWLLAIGLALGWWSHYRFILPLAAAGLWLLVDPYGRALLRRRAVWLSGLLGNAFGLAPLFWHQWVEAGGGFAFQFVERHPWQFQPDQLLEPIRQALVVTPLLYGLLLYALWHGLRQPKHAAQRLWAGFALALLLLTWLLGAFADSERSRAHWPLPAYFALALLLAQQCGEFARPARVGLRVAAVLSAVAAAAGAIYLGIVARDPATLARFERAYPHNFAGWREAGNTARDRLADMPAGSVVVADHFMLAAQLQFALGPSVRVYSLDHPINRKHGRQGELARMRRDEAALATLPAETPKLLMMEESASRLRQRPAWFARLCEKYPRARAAFDRLLDHGRKRLIGYVDERDEPATNCIPAALGYFATPAWGARLAPGDRIQGWALRGNIGLDELRLRLDGKTTLPLEYGAPLPSLNHFLPRLDDPNFPNLGFNLRWPAGIDAGARWLLLEGRSAGQDWVQLASLPVEAAGSD